jgi:hypothetical protein
MDRSKRIDELARSIQRGDYRFDPSVVAEAMLCRPVAVLLLRPDATPPLAMATASAG